MTRRAAFRVMTTAAAAMITRPVLAGEIIVDASSTEFVRWLARQLVSYRIGDLGLTRLNDVEFTGLVVAAAFVAACASGASYLGIRAQGVDIRAGASFFFFFGVAGALTYRLHQPSPLLGDLTTLTMIYLLAGLFGLSAINLFKIAVQSVRRQEPAKPKEMPKGAGSRIRQRQQSWR